MNGIQSLSHYEDNCRKWVCWYGRVVERKIMSSGDCKCIFIMRCKSKKEVVGIFKGGESK